MAIRRAQTADAPVLARIHADSAIAASADFLSQSVLDQLRAQVPTRREVWVEMTEGRNPRGPSVVVAEEEERVVGFVVAAPVAGSEAVGEMLSLYVDPPCQGKGHGSSLLRSATQELQARGFATGALWVLDGNTHAQDIYERRGWQRDGTERITAMGDDEIREIGYRISLLLAISGI
jgi:ribosomal protein S18 acetylase RimI-like enzyme